MDEPRGGPNSGFVRAAKHVALSKPLRRSLLSRIQELAGDGTAERASLYESLIPLLDDFLNASNGSGVTYNDRLGYIYDNVSDGKVSWPIAPLLAWLSFYYDAEARQFYEESKLLDFPHVKYERFSGEPGDWAKLRKERNKPPRPALPQADIDIPRPQNDTGSTYEICLFFTENCTKEAMSLGQEVRKLEGYQQATDYQGCLHWRHDRCSLLWIAEHGAIRLADRQMSP